MLTFSERFRDKTGSFNVLEGMSEDVVFMARHFFQETIINWIELLKSITHGDKSFIQVDEGNLALLWGNICCVPYFLYAERNGFLMDLVDVVDQLLIAEAGISS